MTYNVISTGSSGNAVIINNSILIDCGVSFKALKDVYKDFQLVLLTHSHSDHFKKSTIKRLASERPMLRFGCCEWLVSPLIECGVQKSNIDLLTVDTLFDYKKFQATPVKLLHNVPNCGYKIFIGDEKMIYATDTSSLDGIEAPDFDLYMLEANYTEEDIAERINRKQESGEYAYEVDAMSNHLSKAKCDDFIYNNIGANGTYVYLHQHGSGEL